MRITVTQPLFAWAALEDSPSLGVVRRCMEAVPDAALGRPPEGAGPRPR